MSRIPSTPERRCHAFARTTAKSAVAVHFEALGEWRAFEESDVMYYRPRGSTVEIFQWSETMQWFRSASPLGAVMSAQDIKRAVSQGLIEIKLLREGRDGSDGSDFIDSLGAQDDLPSGSLEGAGYRIFAAKYWDGKEFKPISRKGLKLSPRKTVILQSVQWFHLSGSYCAFHFGLHRNQIAGLQVGSGQIQPGWGGDGLAPLLVVLSNWGTSQFTVFRDRAISRLIFCPLTSETQFRGSTSPAQLLDPIAVELGDITAKERTDLLIRGVIYLVASAFLGVALAFHWGPLSKNGVLTTLAVVIGSQIVFRLGVVITEFFPALRVRR